MSNHNAYMNEDGDWWVMLEDAPTLKEARGIVLDMISYDVPEDGTLRYVGKKFSSVCDHAVYDEHEVGAECDSMCTRWGMAWCFEENRKW